MAPKKTVSFTQKKAATLSLDERMSQFHKRKSATGVDWKEVSATSLRIALQASITEGVAVMFSGAAGGLGVCMTLFMDGERKKEYFMDADELTTYLDSVADAFAGGAEDLRASMVGGKD